MLCVFGLGAISNVHALVFCVVFWLQLSVGVVVDVFVFSFCVLLLVASVFWHILETKELTLNALHWFLHWLGHTNLH